MPAMDPNLWEMLQEGDPEDEVMAVLRLREERSLPEGVRAIAQFGKIVTCRLTRKDIPKVRADPAVASMKAPDPVIPETPPEDFSENSAQQARPTDVRRPEGLKETGRGVVIGVIDWGCDFSNHSFRNPDGSTRLRALWDQQGKSPHAAKNRYGYGTIHDADAINRALKSRAPFGQLNYDPSRSDPGNTGSHGTHVLDIAAGNGRGGGPVGLAPAADLVFVHLSASAGGFKSLGDSVTLLEAVDFIFRRAGASPCVINMSLGNMAGPHDGTTLVEQGLDSAILAAPGRAICQSCGNYFGRGAHASRQIRPGQTSVFEWTTDPADITPNELEIWYSARDQFSVRLRAPDGRASQRVPLGGVSSMESGGQVTARIYNRPVDPNNLDNHVNIFLYPKAPAGKWLVEVRGDDVVDGRMHAWVERDEGCPKCQSKFDPRHVVRQTTTGTIANGFRTIAVGAYNAHAAVFTVAHFSSAGPTRDGRQKPDLCAPGVAVLAARSTPKGGSPGSSLLTRKSGTSMAAPHVTGSVALMFSAAPRPLRIEETRRLLLASAAARDVPPELLPRVGSGVLDARAAVEAARNPERLTEDEKSATPATVVVKVPSDSAKANESAKATSESAKSPSDSAAVPVASERQPEFSATARKADTTMSNYRDQFAGDYESALSDAEYQSEAAYARGGWGDDRGETDDETALDTGDESGYEPYHWADQETGREGVAETGDATELCHACGRPVEAGHGEQQPPPPNPMAPVTLGSATIGGQAFSIVRTNPLLLVSTSHESALRFTITDPLATTYLITGNMLTAAEFEVSSLAAPTNITTFPPVIDVNATAAPGACALIFNKGEACYVPANPISPGRRWVQIPRFKDFYALAPQDQNARRNVWIRHLNRNIGSITVPGVTPDRAWLDARSMPALRLLLAHFGAQMFRVRNVDQPRRNFRGAQVLEGVTRPTPKVPLREPDCYLPVISQVEGGMEDINAFDLGAGVSLGSIQINAIEGKLFTFLSRLNDRDPALFRQVFGTPRSWSIVQDGGHPDLVIAPAGATPITLHGRSADTNRNVGYLQSGTPGNRDFAQIDAAHRQGLAADFRNAVVWPHVQEIILEVNIEFLMPGLNQINDPANGIPRLDVNNPDRDTFVLRALLLSSFVRFSGCLRHILNDLQRWNTVAQKLANLQSVLQTGTFCTQGQRNTLQTRLTAQDTHAKDVHDMIRRIPAVVLSMSAAAARRPIPGMPPAPAAAGQGGAAGRRETAVAAGECECHNENESAARAGEAAALPSAAEWGESLVGYADEARASRAGSESSESLVEAMLDQSGLGDSFFDERSRRALSAAELFDSLNAGEQTPLARHYSRFFEVVARPRTSLHESLLPGDLIVERALGEGSVARVSVVAGGETLTEGEAAESGLTPAVGSRGLYVRVVEGGRAPRVLGEQSEQFARRVARSDGRLGPGQMVLRLRRPGEAEGVSGWRDGEQTTAPPPPPSGPRIPCAPGSSTVLNPALITAVLDIRRLAGITFHLTKPACAATNVCPTAVQSFHATGAATHFGGLTKDQMRLATLTGLFGKDISTLKDPDKLRAAAKWFPLTWPLLDLSFIAIRKTVSEKVGKETKRVEKREIHMHRLAGIGRRFKEAEVEGAVWKCLAYESSPDMFYKLFKLNWPLASLHRQWGKEKTVAWLKALCNFYLDQTGVMLGVGDISHVVGEEMDDEHKGHRLGIDVDLYVLDYPTGTPYPEAFFVDGTKLKAFKSPTKDTERYTSGGAAITAARETILWTRYATLLAYSFATASSIRAYLWNGNGFSKVKQEAINIATAALAAGWKSTWGTAPADAKAIQTAANKFPFVDDPGAHSDHIHIKFTF